MSKGEWIGIERKMHAGHHKIGCHRQLLAGRRPQQRRVITDTGIDIGACDILAHEESLDEIEFVHGRIQAVDRSA